MIFRKFFYFFVSVALCTFVCYNFFGTKDSNACDDDVEYSSSSLSSCYTEDDNMYLDTIENDITGESGDSAWKSVHYFDHLTNHYAYNKNGSCAYVALSMILSYYDTFLSDDVIPDAYDANGEITDGEYNFDQDSPGIRNYNDLSEEPDEYEDFVNTYYVTCYQAYLLKKGFEDYGLINHSDYSSCGLSADIGVHTLVEDFFNDDDNSGASDVLEYSEIDDDDYTSDEILDEVADEIETTGNPVMLSIEQGRTGHVCVAYDVDSSGNVYCHMGSEGYQHVNLNYLLDGTFGDDNTNSFTSFDICEADFITPKDSDTVDDSCYVSSDNYYSDEVISNSYTYVDYYNYKEFIEGSTMSETDFHYKEYTYGVKNGKKAKKYIFRACAYVLEEDEDDYTASDYVIYSYTYTTKKINGVTCNAYTGTAISKSSGSGVLA